MNAQRSRKFPSGAISLWRERAIRQKGHLILSTLLVCVPLVAILTVFGATLRPAKADVTTISRDPLRTSWYSDQNNLSPAMVSSGTFGQQFSANVNGQVYAQPLVSKGVLFIVTENNNVYGLDPLTGVQKWTRNLGIPFNPMDVKCSDLSPSVGITSTPVIDPATNIAYFTEKTYLNGKSGLAASYMHAVDVATGHEQVGFPVLIQGTAVNDKTHAFDATTELQRPGLLLMNGVIYAAFGGHCDRKPYEGWVVGVSTTGKLKTLWTDEAGQPQSTKTGPGGGIWQSGGGLVSDGPGQIIFTSGNGIVPPANTPGKPTPAGALAQSVVRLTVQADGSLKSTDFFTPYDADLLNETDSDVGSGAPMELPTPYFGTKAYPHILIHAGKQGYIFILNADNLGGRGAGQTDSIINRIGPNGGLWSKPGVWPGDGGYVYTTTAQSGGGAGRLKAYKYGLDGAGKPTLSLAGTTADTFGFSSSSPVITSTGTVSGTALIWVVWSPDGTGVGSQLRAYNPIPVNGTLKMLYSASIGTSSKFNSPGIDNNHVYVGTRDGHVLGFGSPVVNALSSAPLEFGNVIVGKQAQGTLTLTANTQLVVTNLAVDNAVFTLGKTTPVLPAKLAPKQTIKIPVTFQPSSPGLIGGSVTVTSTLGKSSFTIAGTGEAASGLISATPAPISFGSTAENGIPITASTTFTNVGATPITITGETLPKAPFSVTGLPALDAKLAPNASVTVALTFAPTKVGAFQDSLILTTTGGTASVPLSGTAGTPGQLTISSLNLNVGNIAIGANGVASFTVSNTGGSPISITRSKFPIAGVGFTAYSTLPEGTFIAPGTSLTETVLFTPSTTGQETDSWSINSDDGNGVKTVNFTGTGIAVVANPTLPSILALQQAIVQPNKGSVVTNIPVLLSSPSKVPVTVNYATGDGTAKVSTKDYSPVSGSLTFKPGQTKAFVPVTVNARTTRGPETDFLLHLSTPTQAVLDNDVAKVYLIQSQGLYAIYAGDVSVHASSNTTTVANFPITLSAPPTPGETVTATVVTADGTGIAGKDYQALATTTVTFNAGEVTKNVAVQVNTANSGVGNKTFLLNIATPSSNAEIADSQAVATIINGSNAPLPSMYISDVNVLQPVAGAGHATFTLSLGATSSAPVTVGYNTVDGTATTAAGYYLQSSGSVTFAPGETTKTVAVTINGTGTYGSNLYFYLMLNNVTNATLGDAMGRATLINQLGRYSAAVSGTSVIQNATSQTLAEVPVSLNAPVANGQTVSVQVSTQDGTAIAGKDYTAVVLKTLTFNAGQQTLFVPVFVSANASAAQPKTFTLILATASSSVRLDDTSATITIISHS